MKPDAREQTRTVERQIAWWESCRKDWQDGGNMAIHIDATIKTLREISAARAATTERDALIKRMLTMIGHAVGAHLVKEDENNPVKQWIADANAVLSGESLAPATGVLPILEYAAATTRDEPDAAAANEDVDTGRGHTEVQDNLPAVAAPIAQDAAHGAMRRTNPAPDAELIAQLKSACADLYDARYFQYSEYLERAAARIEQLTQSKVAAPSLPHEPEEPVDGWPMNPQLRAWRMYARYLRAAAEQLERENAGLRDKRDIQALNCIARQNLGGENRSPCERLQEAIRDAESAEAALREAQKDAGRVDFLQANMLALDTEYGERKECVLVFTFPYSVSADLRRTIDAAIDAAGAKT